MALSKGQERHLHLKALAWSPERNRFAYVLDDEIRGPDASLLQSLHLRDQASQRERLLELPAGRVARLWWLDAQTLVFLHQEPRTAEITPETPLGYRLYRLQADSGERVEIRRFAFDGTGTELYSLSLQNGLLLYLERQSSGLLNLHVINGSAENIYATALSSLRYDAADAHRLYLPDGQSLILLAGRRVAGSRRDTPRLFDVYRFSRGSGELTSLATELKEGSFRLSPDGRYLLQPGQVQDLLSGKSRLINSSGELNSWSSSRLLSLEGAGRGPERVSWYDLLSGTQLATRRLLPMPVDVVGAAADNTATLMGPLLSVADQGVLLWRDHIAWFTPLSETGPEPLSAFRLDAGAPVEVIAEPSGAGPVVIQSQPGGPLMSGAAQKQKQVNLRVYGLSGGLAGQGFYALLDIRAGLP